MAKRQERAVVQNLIDAANLTELARLSGMSEDAFITELARGASGTNLAALELDRQQYIDTLIEAVRRDARDKQAVAKLVQQLKSATPEQRKAIQQKLGRAEVQSDDPERRVAGKRGPITSQIGVDRQGNRRVFLNETPEERLQRIIQQIAGASNRVVQVPGADATNTTGLVPLLGHDSLQRLDEELTQDAANVELRNVFGLDVTDLRDVSDDEKRAMDMASKMEGRAPQLPSNAARDGQSYIVNDEGEGERRARYMNTINVGGGFEPILVPDGQALGGQLVREIDPETKQETVYRMPGAGKDRIDELEDKLSKQEWRLTQPGTDMGRLQAAIEKTKREILAVEIAIDKAVKSYDGQSKTERVWMPVDEAQARGFRTDYVPNVGGDARVLADQYILGGGRGVRAVQRQADAD